MSPTFPFPQPDLQPLEHILAILEPTRLGPDTFEGLSLPGYANRVYGGQVMAQALLAAAATLPGDGASAAPAAASGSPATGDGESATPAAASGSPGSPSPRLPHSMHAYFLRMGNLDDPIRFEVARLHDGRSFSSRHVNARQGERTILSLTCSFQLTQPGLDHQATIPDAPQPQTLPSNAQIAGQLSHPAAWMLLQTGAFDVRHVDSTILLPGSFEPSAHQMVWLRARTPLRDSTPQLIHRALLAYACDTVLLEPVLRAHSIPWALPGLSVASLDHAMWWHRDVDVRDWLLFVQESPSAQSGRGLASARIFDSAGAHVATIAQEGMVRVPEGD